MHLAHLDNVFATATGRYLIRTYDPNQGHRTDSREVYSLIKGARQRLGVSDAIHVGKLPFADVYQGWPGKNVLANLDASLLQADDVSRWTAQVYGVGERGPVRNLDTDTFDRDLVSTPVRAFGAAGGPMQGQIVGLFYRYESTGDFDYLSDFVVGPRTGGASLNNLPGNSGTLWMEDSPAESAARTGSPTAHARSPKCGSAPGRRAAPPAAAFDQSELMALYSAKDFCGSYALQRITVRENRIVPK